MSEHGSCAAKQKMAIDVEPKLYITGRLFAQANLSMLYYKRSKFKEDFKWQLYMQQMQRSKMILKKA